MFAERDHASVPVRGVANLYAELLALRGRAPETQAATCEHEDVGLHEWPNETRVRW
jgi:hypothetical protein